MRETNELEYELRVLLRQDDRAWRMVTQSMSSGLSFWDLTTSTPGWLSATLKARLASDEADDRRSPTALHELVCAEDRDAAAQFTRECESGGAGPFTQLLRFGTAGNSPIAIQCHGMILREQDGTPARLLIVHSDVNESHASHNDSARVTTKPLMSADELLMFSRAVLHDLKAPANSIAALLTEFEYALSGAMTDDRQELLDLANQSTAQLQSMVEDLAWCSKLILRDSVKKTVENLCDLARQAAGNLADRIEKTNTVIEIRPMPDLRCCAEHIVVLFECLISNGVKYAHRGTNAQIELGLQQCNTDSITLYVKDRGVGIPADKHEEAFTMFRRLHRQDEIPGTGIGLAVSRGIARRHGGDIRISELDGGGTQVTVELSRT